MPGPRALLIGAPLLVVAVLLQSFFWVPAYDSGGAANPARDAAFVEASIGDARLLNPILNADVSSARIANLVFDGLLRIDEDLSLAGAIAERWELAERAYLAVEDAARADAIAARLARYLEQTTPGLLRSPPAVLPPEDRTVDQVVAGKDEPVEVRIRVPTRIVLDLDRVVPKLDRLVAQALDGNALAPIDRTQRIDAGDVALPDGVREALLPRLEHNPRITFWLRPDVRFHDGHPVDAGDVVFTWRAIMDPRNLSPRRSDFEPIKEVLAREPHVVEVVYKRLFSPAVNVWTMGLLPEHLLDDAAMRREAVDRNLGEEARAAFAMRDSAFNRAPVGAGAFRFRRWASDELIHLSRNADYYRAPPLFEQYYFRILPDTLTQELEFRAGAIDTYVAEPHQAARYRNDQRYQSFSAVQPAYTYIGYNLRRAPFDDVRVRRALGMAIDVDTMIRYALFDEGERVTGPFASITRWYDQEVTPLPYDPAAAEALLAEAGWRRGADGWLEKDGKRLEFNLITNHGNMRRKAVVSIVQQAWQRIGVKVNVQLFEWAVFLKDFINPGAFDAVVLGWRLGLDPDLYQIWHSSQTDPNELNFVGLKDEEADRLIEALRREYDVVEQERIAHALHRRIAALAPYTFLYAPRATRLLERRIVMATPQGGTEPVRAGGAGDVFHHMNRWFRSGHDPGS